MPVLSQFDFFKILRDGGHGFWRREYLASLASAELIDAIGVAECLGLLSVTYFVILLISAQFLRFPDRIQKSQDVQLCEFFNFPP